jgi:fumarate reductase flavoprotein subunit
LAEFVVFGRVTGENAVKRVSEFKGWNDDAIATQIQSVEERIQALMNQEGDENWADIRTEMGHTIEVGCGIYRQEDLMQATIEKITELKERYKRISIKDKGKVFNTNLLYAIEVGYGLEVAEAMVHSAILRKEYRGAHQRLDDGCTERDDEQFLKHSLAYHQTDASPSIQYSDVTITKSQPKARLYGEAAEKSAAEEAAKAEEEKA